MNLQTILSHLRAVQYLSCLDISTLSGISLFRVYELERGAIEMLRMQSQELEALAEAYGVTPRLLETLLDEEYEVNVCGFNFEPLPTRLARLLTTQNFVVLDTETTGKNTQIAEIVQIAIIDHDGKPLLHSLVKPLASIPQEATNIHGLTDEDVKDAPSLAQLWPRLCEAVEGKVVVVYNADYDITLLQSLATRQHLPFPEIEPFCLMVEYAKHWRIQSKSHRDRWQSLTKACQQQGVVLEEAHSALGDVLATLALLKKLAAQKGAWRLQGDSHVNVEDC